MDGAFSKNTNKVWLCVMWADFFYDRPFIWEGGQTELSHINSTFHISHTFNATAV